jgi:hypothetical protein
MSIKLSKGGVYARKVVELFLSRNFIALWQAYQTYVIVRATLIFGSTEEATFRKKKYYRHIT